MIFGCTHYAIFDKYIEEKYGYKTFNMGSTAINQLSEGNNSKIEILFTKLNEQIENNVKDIINRKFEIKEVSLEGVLK